VKNWFIKVESFPTKKKIMTENKTTPVVLANWEAEEGESIL
jgi:hypothetical protein